MTQRPLFIGGLMKSGTSLARALTGNHSNIFGGLETWWFSQEFQSEYKDKDSKTAKKLQALYGVNTQAYDALAYVSHHYLDFLDRFLLNSAAKEFKTRWVEKTPDNIFHLDKLKEFWGGNYLFIYIMRNPLDTFASWKKNTSHPISLFEHKIHDTVKILSSNTFQTSKSHRLIVYEDLILNTKAVMKTVIDFMEESWEDGIEINRQSSTEYNLVKNFANKHSTTLASLSKPIFTSSINQYKNILDQKEIDAINQFAKGYLKIYQASCMPKANNRS